MTRDDDLAERLLVLAGMIMEDTVPAMLLTDAGPLADRIGALRKAAAGLTVLAAALDVAERYGRSAQDHGADPESA